MSNFFFISSFLNFLTAQLIHFLYQYWSAQPILLNNNKYPSINHDNFFDFEALDALVRIAADAPVINGYSYIYNLHTLGWSSFILGEKKKFEIFMGPPLDWCHSMRKPPTKILGPIGSPLPSHRDHLWPGYACPRERITFHHGTRRNATYSLPLTASHFTLQYHRRGAVYFSIHHNLDGMAFRIFHFKAFWLKIFFFNFMKTVKKHIE